MDVSVVVGTFGTPEWGELARARAIPSAEAAGAVKVIHMHRKTLADARNAGLAQVETEWVIHLDADDELDPRYIDAMSRGMADVRGPMAVYIRAGQERIWQPRVAGHTHDCTAGCITSGQGNWLVVGAAVRTDLARETGWKDWPCYEDFDFWMRALLTGATAELVPDAFYRAHVRRDSRNRAPAMCDKDRVHHRIVAANLVAA